MQNRWRLLFIFCLLFTFSRSMPGDMHEDIPPGAIGVDVPQEREQQHEHDQHDNGDRHEARSRGKAIQWVPYEAKPMDAEDDEDDETEETLLVGFDPNDRMKLFRFLKKFKLRKGNKSATAHNFKCQRKGCPFIMRLLFDGSWEPQVFYDNIKTLTGFHVSI